MAPLGERLLDLAATGVANVLLLGIVAGSVQVLSWYCSISFWQGCVVMLLVQNTATIRIDRSLWK